MSSPIKIIFRPGGGETICPRKCTRNKDQRQSMNPEIAADLPPSADGSAVRASLVPGGGYAAGSQPACLWPRQLRRGTDRRAERGIA